MPNPISGVPLKVAYVDLGYQAPVQDTSLAARLSGYSTVIYQRKKKVDSPQIQFEVSTGLQNFANYLGPAVIASKCLTPTTNPSTGNPGVFEFEEATPTRGTRGVLTELPLNIRQVDSVTRDVMQNELSARVKYFPDKTELEYCSGRQRNNCGLRNAVELCLFGKV
jgi:hypothetical protein